MILWLGERFGVWPRRTRMRMKMAMLMLMLAEKRMAMRIAMKRWRCGLG